MKKIVLKILIFVNVFVFAQNNPSQITIKGKVLDQFKKPISNVNITHNNFGTISSPEGEFQLKLSIQNKLNIKFSHVGYKIQNLEINANNKSFYDLGEIILTDKDNYLSDVKITSDEYRFKGFTTIDPKKLEQLPSISGGVESIIKLLPGVSASNELSNQYSVRGGNYDENLIYINGIEIYKPFLVRNGQQEGLSIINSNLVSSIEFSAGGFDAKFGDKLSSVLNIKYFEPKTQKTNVNLSPLGLELSTMGTSKNYLLSYQLGARVKTNRSILNSMDDNNNYNSRFGDIQSLIKYDLNSEIQLSFFSYYSENKYEMIPISREAKFGTVSEALQLTIYFEGKEVDSYITNLNALSSKYSPNENLEIRLTSSFFNTKEQEFYDILGEYWLGELDNNLGSDQLGEVVFNRGVGAYMNHARNELSANVWNMYFDGIYNFKLNDLPFELNWGGKFQIESVTDNIREWVMIDSAGYSISPFNNDLNLYEFYKGNSHLESKRTSSYFQISNDFKIKNDKINWILGARFNYWDFNNELFISPRFNINYKPQWNRDFIFNASIGSYNQSPFFREFRDNLGNLNTNIKSQKSIHYVVNSDYQFNYLNRPFKLTTSIFYKKLWDLIPFELDNLQINYLNENNATGYSAGLDFKIFGEFVPDVDSWLSLSLLTTRENIKGDGYGYIPRPTDRRLNASVFFQDYFPNNPNYKMQLSLSYGSGLPFGAPNTERYQQTLRIPSYKRLDIGFSRSIKRTDKKSKLDLLNNFKSIWASLEIFNLVNIQNTSSYIWVSDASNRYYAVPNYLTGRLFIFKVNLDF